MDAQTLRRALADFFKFNPQDFIVTGTPTGYLVRLTSKSQRVAVNDTGFLLTVGQSISATASGGNVSGSYASVIASMDAAKAGVDLACANTFSTNKTNAAWGTSTILSTEFPLVMPVSRKTFFLSQGSPGGSFNGAVSEVKSVSSVMLSHFVAGDFAYRISYKITKTTTVDGVVAPPVETTGNFTTPATNFTGIKFTELTPAPDIIAEAWPPLPSAPAPGDVYQNTVELKYEITNIQRIFV